MEKLPINIVDVVIVLIFLGVVVYYVKRGFFVAVFYTLRLVLSYSIALLLTVPLGAVLLTILPLQPSLVGIFVQGICFAIIWFGLGVFRPTFDQVIIATIGKLSVFYHLYKYATVFPAIVTAIILNTVLFTLLLSTSVVSSPHLLAGQSWWGRQVVPHIFAYSISTKSGFNFQPYKAFAYQVSRQPIVFSSSERVIKNRPILVPENQYQQVIEQANRINQVRQEAGLSQVVPPPIILTPAQKPETKKDPEIVQTPEPIPANAPLMTIPTLPPISMKLPQVLPMPTYTANPVQSPQNLHQPNSMPAPTPTQAPSQAPAPILSPPAASMATMEKQILDATNAERRKAGVAELVWDDAIAAVARAHSQDMATRRFFAHVNPDGVDPFKRLQLGGMTFGTAAENIAMYPTVESAMTGWMNSQGHRTNILSSAFKKLGVGIASGNTNYYFAQNFTN